MSRSFWTILTLFLLASLSFSHARADVITYSYTGNTIYAFPCTVANGCVMDPNEPEGIVTAVATFAIDPDFSGTAAPTSAFLSGAGIGELNVPCCTVNNYFQFVNAQISQWNVTAGTADFFISTESILVVNTRVSGDFESTLAPGPCAPDTCSNSNDPGLWVETSDVSAPEPGSLWLFCGFAMMAVIVRFRPAR